MKATITANELKTRGVSLLDELTSDGGEAFISVRGKTKYIVLSVDEYNRLRDCELDMAVREAEQDLAAGRFVKETVEEHIKRINGE